MADETTPKQRQDAHFTLSKLQFFFDIENGTAIAKLTERSDPRGILGIQYSAAFEDAGYGKVTFRAPNGFISACPTSIIYDEADKTVTIPQDMASKIIGKKFFPTDLAKQQAVHNLNQLDYSVYAASGSCIANLPTDGARTSFIDIIHHSLSLLGHNASKNPGLAHWDQIALDKSNGTIWVVSQARQPLISAGVNALDSSAKGLSVGK